MGIGRTTDAQNRHADVTQLLDANQAARRLGLSVRSVKDYARKGILPGRKLPGRGFNGAWRFDPIELMAAWRGHTQREEVRAVLLQQQREEIINRVKRLLAAGVPQIKLREVLDKFVPGGQLRDLQPEDFGSFRAHLLRLGHKT